MAKLFAMEELENELTGAEMEVSPEEGEVADVQVDVEQEVGEVTDGADAIEEGMGAADQLEQVEEVVGKAAEGEGLDDLSAEAIRIAVEAICARVGANPKAVYSLYATENFQSASSRKANTKIALEGVGEFLKDMWKKIKAALQNLWTKVKAFWEKHISSLGRIKKALESMKQKVGESSGKLKDKAYIDEAPSGLVEAVGFEGDISVSTITKIITTHKTLLDTTSEIVAATDAFNNKAAAKIIDPKGAADSLSGVKDYSVGPVVGGVTISYKWEKDATEGTVTLEVERENVDRKDKGGVSLAEKNDVKNLVDSMLKVIVDNIKAKEKMTKLQESFNKLSLSIEKAINTSNQDQKAMRDSMKIAYKINAKAPVINNEALALNIKLSKSILGYAALCLKNYK